MGLYFPIVRTTKSGLVLVAVVLVSTSAGAQVERHPFPGNATEANPYGDGPCGAALSEARLEPAIDASNPYAFTGSGAALPERALPKVAALRDLDFENPYGAGLAAVEHAPIDSENPYITGTR